MIFEKITADLHKAIIEKDVAKKDLLRVVIAEMCRYTKVATDEEAIKVLKKSIESAKLCNTLSEIPILESYLPATISDEELTTKLTEMVDAYNGVVKNTGEKMKDAKALLGSDFDGKRVSIILNKI